MKYHAYELAHAMVSPWRLASQGLRYQLDFPFNPLSALPASRSLSAACHVFERLTNRYGKPDWEIEEAVVDGKIVPVSIDTVRHKPFCNLIHFKREQEIPAPQQEPKVLLVAPMSGHYATLLRGTVQAMLPEHDVYVTDWIDARDVPASLGTFDLDDYTDYLIDMCRYLAQDGTRPAVMAVCQPGVPMLVAASLMAEDKDPARPASVTLMGSPIDTARNPKQPNELATSRPLSWFENNVIVTVPWPNLGFMRRVYPGFLQLSGFMSMNMDRHVNAHTRQFGHLIRGDGDSALAHRVFYDEYLAVMDLTAEFYLATIDRVFQRRLLATGEYDYRDRRVDPSKVKDIAVMTIEGEKDDITGLQQTEAAHDLLTGLAKSRRKHYVVPKVGHYGVFNGSRFRKHVQPRIRDFIRKHHGA